MYNHCILEKEDIPKVNYRCRLEKKNCDNIIYWKIVKKRIFTRYGNLNYFEKSEEIRNKK